MTLTKEQIRARYFACHLGCEMDGNHMPKILIESKGISIGRGNPDWGAPIDTDVFILSLGKILETKNIK